MKARPTDDFPPQLLIELKPCKAKDFRILFFMYNALVYEGSGHMCEQFRDFAPPRKQLRPRGEKRKFFFFSPSPSSSRIFLLGAKIGEESASFTRIWSSKTRETTDAPIFSTTFREIFGCPHQLIVSNTHCNVSS